MVSETGSISGMTLAEFCERVGIDMKTTWRWRNQIPDLATRIRERREEIVPLARETAAWNRLFLIGMTSLPTREKEVTNPKTGKTTILRYGNKHDDQRAAVDALKTYVEQYGGRNGPMQRHEVKVEGNFLDMMAAAAKDGVIEGQVVGDEPPTANFTLSDIADTHGNTQPQADA